MVTERGILTGDPDLQIRQLIHFWYMVLLLLLTCLSENAQGTGMTAK